MARGIPFVATGEPIMCTMGSAFNTIKATSGQSCAAQIAITGDWLKTDTHHYRIKGQHPLTVASCPAVRAGSSSSSTWS